jgi:hypothetical protein
MGFYVYSHGNKYAGIAGNFFRKNGKRGLWPSGAQHANRTQKRKADRLPMGGIVLLVRQKKLLGEIPNVKRCAHSRGAFGKNSGGNGSAFPMLTVIAIVLPGRDSD